VTGRNRHRHGDWRLGDGGRFGVRLQHACVPPAGREKLREVGFAPPAPREAALPTLVQLQSSVFRCPYCGSTDTRLENLFGPTPCRSLRYCASCRQPFEQFKTI
jgi:ring-1,2-phenylacetyl-CoA epoxidase subunit PaaD